MSKGKYTFINNNARHPIGFCKNNIKQLIIKGSVNMGKGLINDCLVNHYLGEINIEVLDDFGTISYHCLNDGYMGGKERLIYSEKCANKKNNNQNNSPSFTEDFKSSYLNRIEENVESKAEIPYTFYAVLQNYKIKKGDTVGIFQDENLIGKYKFDEDKDSGSVAVNIFLKNRTSPVLILLKLSHESITKWHKINFDENNSNYKDIPIIKIESEKNFNIESGFKINFKN